MGRQRTDRKLIHDRIQRNLNAIIESKRRLEEVVAMLQEASHGDEDSYIEQQGEIFQICLLLDEMETIHRQLYEVF